MIDIAKLSQKDLGRPVLYIPFKGCDISLYEYGKIKSFNESFIFVVYGRTRGRGVATSPHDLIFCDWRDIWWGYLHKNSSIQVKIFIDFLDIDDAYDSDLVQRVFLPFKANNRDDAINYIKKIIENA